MLGTLTPDPVFQPLRNGLTLPGGKLYTYAAGTDDPLLIYQDASLTVPHPWPAVLDSDGKLVIYLKPTSYKFNLTDSLDVPIDIYPIDNIQSVTAGQAIGPGDAFLFGGDAASPLTNIAYPVGNGFDKLHAGTSVMSLDSAQLAGTYELEAMLAGDGASTVSVALVNLDDGAPDTPLVSVSTNSTGARQRSGAITFAAPGAAKSYGIKAKIDTGSGYAWGVRLIRVS